MPNSAQMSGRVQAHAAASRSEAVRAQQFVGGEYRILGVVDVTGAGEAVASVNFPVWFSERPAMSFGGELGANEKVVTGEYPTVSVVVQKWRTVKRDLHDFYIGADLIVVTTGHDDKQRTKVHWQAEGPALVNPTLF